VSCASSCKKASELRTAKKTGQMSNFLARGWGRPGPSCKAFYFFLITGYYWVIKCEEMSYFLF